MPKKIKSHPEGRKNPSKNTNDILKKYNQVIPNTTYNELIEKTQLSRYLIRQYCMFNNLKPKQNVTEDKRTKQKLELLKKIDTSKKTQNELSKILGYETRQAISIFLKKHKIKYKPSNKNSVTKKRIEKLEQIGIKKLRQMNIYDIADILDFEGENVYLYTSRFLRTHFYK